MSLSTDIAADLAAHHFDTDEFAQDVDYNGSTVPAVVKFMDNLDEQTGAMVAVGQILIRVSDVASPTYRDPVIIGSDTWYVRKINKGDAFTWLLDIYRDERPIL